MKSRSCSCALLLLISCLAWVGVDLAHAEDAAPKAPSPAALPRLVDLGAARCVPCRLMKPILEKLTAEYHDQFEVVFIDVWEKKEEARRYGIRMIPTQIFYDAAGVERARHEGFMSEADILATWKQLGVEVKPPTGKRA